MKAICGIRWTPEAAELEGNNEGVSVVASFGSLL
ncbi:hypothetical protein BH18ACT3_BH18ACT3_19870 [soil metagenome]